jgi:hypothetical protein
LAGFETHFRSDSRTKPDALRLVSVVCFLLLVLLTFVQVAHTHPFDSDADHCPLCIVMHSAAPVIAAAAVVRLVQVGTPAPFVEPRDLIRHWHPKLFTRPPPAAC